LRQLIFLGFLVIVLIAGGLLMTSITQPGAASAAPAGIKVQTSNPEANVSTVTAQKGAQFIVFVVVVLGALGGGVTTFTLIIWLMNAWVRQANAQPNVGFSWSLKPSVPNSLGAVIAKNPVATIIITILTIGALVGGAILTSIILKS
jgi:hypothetical protein